MPGGGMRTFLSPRGANLNRRLVAAHSPLRPWGRRGWVRWGAIRQCRMAITTSEQYEDRTISPRIECADPPPPHHRSALRGLDPLRGSSLSAPRGGEAAAWPRATMTATRSLTSPPLATSETVATFLNPSVAP